MISCTICLFNDPSNIASCYIQEDKDFLCIEKGNYKLVHEALSLLFSEEKDWFDHHKNNLRVKFKNNISEKKEKSLRTFIKTLCTK